MAKKQAKKTSGNSTITNHSIRMAYGTKKEGENTTVSLKNMVYK